MINYDCKYLQILKNIIMEELNMLKQKKKYIMFFLALIVFLVMITNDSRVIAASETNNEIITMQEAEGIAINHFYYYKSYKT